MGNELPIVAQALGMLMGSGLILGGIAMTLFATKAQRWPTTNGTVTETEVNNIAVKPGEHSWKPIVKYDYEVNGQKFSGSRLRLFSGTHATQGLAQKAVEEYSKGSRVIVYYHPADASKSVLIPSIDGSLTSIAGMYIGGVVLIAVIIYLRVNGLPA